VHVDDLHTPYLAIDLDRLEANAAAMRDRCHELGVRLRPHVKTTKCVEAARIQLGGSHGPITVATLAEARGFAVAGFTDVTYAVPTAPTTARELCRLAGELERLRLDVDHPAAVDALESAARHAGMRLELMLEVDCGDHRCGVDPSAPASVELAHRIADSPVLAFAGILTHPGHSYRARRREDAARVADHERDTVVAFADRLRASGVEVGEVSIGSTPTVMAASDLDGVTEVRPGNYVVFDAFQAAIGSCTFDEVACSVVTEIRGVYPDRGELVVDAGALALSVDPGPRHVDADCGFGVPCDLESGRPIPGMRVVKLSQEHAVVRSDGTFDVTRLAPGDRLRIVPNHSCLAIACHEVLHVVRGSRVVDEWFPIRGW
jgi:D-serine deaminase-like pyridoxal phosphate-dependent protein